MDPRDNPYAPGAGSPPPELAGRDEIIERAAVALDRIRAKRASRSLILYGFGRESPLLQPWDESGVWMWRSIYFCI